MVGKREREHEFVPVHEILSESEAKKVLEELNTTIDKLPKILDTDPQAKKLEAKPGQVIKIHRNDSGNEYFNYREVVKA